MEESLKTHTLSVVLVKLCVHISTHIRILILLHILLTHVALPGANGDGAESVCRQHSTSEQACPSAFCPQELAWHSPECGPVLARVLGGRGIKAPASPFSAQFGNILCVLLRGSRQNQPPLLTGAVALHDSSSFLVSLSSLLLSHFWGSLPK